MKDILQTLVIAMSIGLIVFCMVIIFDRNSGSIEWNKRSEQVRAEAERTSENVDKYVKKGKRVYTKLKEMEDEDIGARPAEPKVVPPPPVVSTTPAPTTPNKPLPMSIPTVAPSNSAGYQIQIGRLSGNTPDLSSFVAIQHLGALRVELSGADKRVVLGNFANRSQADAALAEVRRLGFGDAFVTIPTTINNTIATPKSSIAAASLYTVQVVANKYPVGSDYKPLAKWGSLYQEKNADLTKIMLGTFKDETAARNVLQNVKAQGFDGAFIKTVTWSTINSWQKIN